MKRLLLFNIASFIMAAAISGCGRGITSTAAVSPNILWAANGYELTPAGVQIGADRKSIAQAGTMAITPDGKTVLVLSTGWVKTGGSHGITVIDAMADTITSYLSLSPYESFYGMAVTSTFSGFNIFVPGIQNQKGYVLDISMNAGRKMSFQKAIPLSSYYSATLAKTLMPTPAGIAISGNTLLTANNVGYNSGTQYPGETVSIIDLSTMSQTYTVTVGQYPWAIAVTPDGKNAYVTNRGSGTVSVISLAGAPTVTATIPVQTGPAAIASSADGTKIYVANTLSDSVSVINTKTNIVADTITLAAYAGAPTVGGSPDGLAFSNDGKWLYVALAADNSIAVIDTASNQVIGRIPTAWYPADIAVDPVNDHIFAVNTEGIGHGPWMPALIASNTWDILDFAHYDWYVHSSVSDITKPAVSQLSIYTAQVLKNDFVNPEHAPVPANVKAAWSNITHVVYILRENKTYDMEFGDLGPSANGEPIPCPYYAPGSLSARTPELGCSGSGIGFTTPNTHAMARQFALDTNFYLDVETSIQGHPLAIDGFLSDYLQRIWSINTDYGGANRADDSTDPIATLPSNSLFQELYNAGITFSDFGESLITLRPISIQNNNLLPETVMPGYNATWANLFSDTQRAAYFVSTFNSMVQTNSFPQFVYLTLGDDHYPPGDYSDNDYATAMIVDAISHSPYWKNTVIFIDEDDPQVGIDHIDQKRSFAIVISPYVKHGYISNEHYTFTSILKTIELIFNLPPMTQYDDTALPMYDMFQSTPDLTPFTALPETWSTILSPTTGG